MDNEGTKKPKLWHRFVAGALGDMTATLFTQPLDLGKVRYQLRGELQQSGSAPRISLVQLLGRIYRTEGVKGLYQGLSAALLRHSLFSSIRQGGFGVFLSYYQSNSTQQVSLGTQIFAGCCTGMIGAIVGNPADVVLVRMLADGHWPAPDRRNYKNAFNGISRIVREEGITTLWRGCLPTVARAGLITSTQLPVYGISKNFFTPIFGDNYKTWALSSVVTGFAASVVTCPVDIVKTRMMNMNENSSLNIRYNSTLDCVWKISKIEGLSAFYKGFVPTFLRLGPHNLVLWIAFEKYTELLRENL